MKCSCMIFSVVYSLRIFNFVKQGYCNAGVCVCLYVCLSVYICVRSPILHHDELFDVMTNFLTS